MTCQHCGGAIVGRLNQRRRYCGLACRYAYHALGVVPRRGSASVSPGPGRVTPIRWWERGPETPTPVPVEAA